MGNPHAGHSAQPSTITSTTRSQKAKAPHFEMATLNVTSSRTLYKIVPSLTVQLAFVQEHRMDEKALELFTAFCRKNQFLVAAAPAFGRGKRAKTGVLILYKSHLTRVGNPVVLYRARAVSVVIKFAKIGAVEFVSAYGKSGRDIRPGSINDKLQFAIAEHLDKSNKPYIVGGDFNLTPHQLQGWMHNAGVKGQIQATSLPTFITSKVQSTIDYYVHCNTIAMLLGEPQVHHYAESKGAQTRLHDHAPGGSGHYG